MKQVWIPYTGDPSVLEVREAADPEPGPGEVRIRVEASGVNFADVMARMGLYPDAPKLPAVVGYEVAGVIDAVGLGGPRHRMGDPVVAATQFGGYSSHIVVPQDQAVVRPPGLDAVTAAAIPVTGLTAWMMLEEMGRIRQGDRVLIHSAGGGVGLMCLDLALRRGATAVGTASPAKHEMLRSLGYAQLVDYRTQDFAEVLAGEPPFDLIVDPIGGESWAKSGRLLKTGGRLICFGFAANVTGTRKNWLEYARNVARIPWFDFTPMHLVDSNTGVMGVNMGRMWSETERLRGWLHQLLELWSQDILRPIVHAAIPFSNAAEAHRVLHARENLGKVVLTPD